MRRLVTLLTAVVLLGCERGAAPPPPPDSPAAAARPWFDECAEARGLRFTYASGHDDRPLFPEIVGGGAALFDADGDGDLDAYLVQGGSIQEAPAKRPPNRLFMNDGAGVFTDSTDASGADDRGYGMGVTAGDVDNDGDIDLYVTNVGRNTLLRNDGAGRFTDDTVRSGTGDEGWGASAAMLDYDRDGDLDLFVVNYIHWSLAVERECYATTGERDYCAPAAYAAPAPDRLYRNDGDGVFTDVSKSAGIDATFGNGLGVVVGDLDGNGWLDIYVANDATANQMWLNQGDGSFTDASAQMGTALDDDGRAKAGMGVVAEDFDDDRDLDLLVVNLEGEADSLYINEGGYFTDQTRRAALAATTRHYTRFGVGALDFDHDGALDLYQANGRVRRTSRSAVDDPFAEPNSCLRGSGRGTFEPVAPAGGTEPLLVATSRGAAFGDVDGDGAVDVLVVNRDAPAHLLRNRAGASDRSITFRVVEEHGRDALGATVECRVGDRWQRRDVRPAYSYCSSSDPRVHFGLGHADGVEDVRVRWIDGDVESFGGFSAGSRATLERAARDDG